MSEPAQLAPVEEQHLPQNGYERVLSDLDVLLRDEPGPVCQQLVERLQAAEFAGCVLEAAQPDLLPSSLQETCAVLLHQVQALMSSRRL